MVCSIPGCGRRFEAKGLCPMHYARLRRGHPMHAPPKKEYGRTPEERFFRQIEYEPNSGCWLWSGTLRHGYGSLKIGNDVFSAHRFSWEMLHGPIPEYDSYHGLCVLHRCDTRPCCNPEHLYLGTPLQNARDAVDRNRLRPRLGERNHAAILTSEQVTQIRKMLAEKRLTQTQIGREFGVSQATISVINTRKIWGWLD